MVCDRDKIHLEALHGAPDLVMEILSPSTQKRDFTAKYKKYADSGVREYWIFDPKKRKVIVYRLDLINEYENQKAKAESDKTVKESSGSGNDEQGEKIAIFGFDAEVPVGIYGGDCRVDFRTIYENLKFMFEQ